MTDAGMGRREALELLGTFASAAIASTGTVGEAGATGLPAQSDEGFDPAETDLASWSVARDQVFDTHDFYNRVRRDSEHPFNDSHGRWFNWRDPDERDPIAAVSWPEIVRDEDGTVLLQPAARRNLRHAGFADPDAAFTEFYGDNFGAELGDRVMLDSYTSRPQTRLEFPGVLDLLDVTYVPIVESWRYTFAYTSSARALEYRGMPSHAHDPSNDRELIRSHGINLDTRNDLDGWADDALNRDRLTFVTAEGSDGLEHAVSVPRVGEEDLSIEELERRLGYEVTRGRDGGFHLVIEEPTAEEIAVIAAVAVIGFLGPGWLALAAGFALDFAMAWLSAGGGGTRQEPGQVDPVTWTYDTRQRPLVNHTRIWGVDVPAVEEPGGVSTSFQLRDAYSVEHRVWWDVAQQQPVGSQGDLEEVFDYSQTDLLQEDTTENHLEERTHVRAEGRYHVRLPLLSRPREMSPVEREYYDVRPFCHPEDGDRCYYKAYGALPEVAHQGVVGRFVDPDDSWWG